MEKEAAFETLKALLLEDDRKLNVSLQNHIKHLEKEFLSPEKFAEKVDTIAQTKVDDLKKNFSIYFRNDLTEAIQYELKNSHDEVINSLYPIIGKLINRFIKAELEKLAEDIDSRIKNTFSAAVWKQRFKAFFSGNSSSDILLSELNNAKIIEVFVIQNGSGLLIGHSNTELESLDKDMVAALLTAIKAFAEDTFSQKNESLSTIEYESIKLLVQTYHTLTVAFAVKGIVNTDFKQRLHTSTDDFVEQLLNNLNGKNIDYELQARISRGIDNFFLKKNG